MPTYMSDTEAEIDVQAFSLLPPSVPEGLFPVQTEGDGNYFPRSVSTLVFGHPCNFVEVRCRVVTEHVLNKAAYLAGIGLGHDVNECQSVVAMQVVLAEGLSAILSERSRLLLKMALTWVSGRCLLQQM